MSQRTRKLTLKFLDTQPAPSWKVVSLQNSIRYNPGDLLTKEQVNEIISLGLFELTVTGAKP